MIRKVKKPLTPEKQAEKDLKTAITKYLGCMLGLLGVRQSSIGKPRVSWSMLPAELYRPPTTSEQALINLSRDHIVSVSRVLVGHALAPESLMIILSQSTAAVPKLQNILEALLSEPLSRNPVTARPLNFKADKLDEAYSTEAPGDERVEGPQQQRAGFRLSRVAGY